MAASSSAIVTAIIIDLVVFVIAFTAFSWLRTSKWCEKYYSPKRNTLGVQHMPSSLPNNLFGWVLPVWWYKEPKIITRAGLDTAMYLRIMNFGTELFFWISLWCLITMLPVNLVGHEVDDLMSGDDSSNFKFTNFDKLSLSNVSGGSPHMWVHMISVYVVSIVALKLLWRYNKESVLLRIMYLANSRRAGSTHTVLVTDIPAIADATQERLKARKQREKLMKKAERDKARRERQAQQEGHASDLEQQLNTTRSMADSLATAAVPLREHETALSGPDAAAPVQQQLRHRRFTYDLKDPSLSPTKMAQAMLRTGMSPKELVASEFKFVYPPDDVDAVNMVYDQSALTPLVEEYNKLKQDLEDYLDECYYRFSKGQEVSRKQVFVLLPTLGAWGKERYGSGLIKKVDALQHWTSRLQELERLIAEEQERAYQNVWAAAFVSFKSRRDTAIASTTLHHHDETTWVTKPAPEHYEVIWENLGMPAAERSTRNITMWTLFWLMCLFYMIPIAAIQGLIEVSTRVTSPEGLRKFLQNVVVSKLLEAIVPGLALNIFLALVPMILKIMVKQSGAASQSALDFGVVTRFYIFQVLLVFVGTVITGSFFSQLEVWVHDPTSVVTTLGTAIPMTTTFFITYIWVNTFIAKPISAIRIVGLIIFALLTKLSGSPRARARLWRDQYTTYGTTVCGHTITILLGVVFSCINPIVCPSALVYFVVTTILERYYNIYVYKRNYESSGKLWGRVFMQVMVAMYIFQLCMLGLLGIKKFKYAPLLIPLILATIAFHITCSRLFARPWKLMSLHDAAELDMADAEQQEQEERGEKLEAEASSASAGSSAQSDVEAQQQEEEVDDHVPQPDNSRAVGPGATADAEVAEERLQLYLSPVFKVKQGAIQPLLQQAEEMGDIIDRYQAEVQEAKTAAKATGSKYQPPPPPAVLPSRPHIQAPQAGQQQQAEGGGSSSGRGGDAAAAGDGGGMGASAGAATVQGSHMVLVQPLAAAPAAGGLPVSTAPDFAADI